MGLRRYALTVPLGLLSSIVLACNSDNLTVPSTGSLEITTTTIGAVPDIDGYAVRLDSEQPRAVGGASSFVVNDLAPGAHTVLLEGLAANCTVAGDNPRTANLTAGDTVAVAFEVTCSTTTGVTGTLEITTVTNGASLDSDGYALTVDGGSPQPVGGNATLSLTVTGSLGVNDPGSGTHAVLLEGLAANCTVAGDNPRTVSVTAGDTVALTFDVTCTAITGTTGTLAITTVTTGASLDLDGYALTVDGGNPQPVAANGALSLTVTGAVSHEVVLSGIAANCQLQGTPSRQVTVPAGGSGKVDFAIVCAAPAQSKIAFSTLRNGGWDLYLMNPDGSGLTNLTANVVSDPIFLRWSPDASRIVFQDLNNLDIAVINADGTGFRNLTNTAPITNDERSINEEFQPAWSPDGTRVAFEADRAPVSSAANWDIYVVNVDGTGLADLTQSPLYDFRAAWSPDGRRISYVSGCGSSVCLMNADGTGKTPVTTSDAADGPAWSPDGRLLLFSVFISGGTYELHVVSPDGTGERALISGAAASFSPVWSPDGSQIAFAGADIEVINPDGSGRRQVTHSGRNPARLTWSPDGKKIAFVGPGAPPYNGYDTDIYVADVATGDEANITNNPAPDDYPAWSPK